MIWHKETRRWPDKMRTAMTYKASEYTDDGWYNYARSMEDIFVFMRMQIVQFKKRAVT